MVWPALPRPSPDDAGAYRRQPSRIDRYTVDLIIGEGGALVALFVGEIDLRNVSVFEIAKPNRMLEHRSQGDGFPTQRAERRLDVLGRADHLAPLPLVGDVRLLGTRTARPVGFAPAHVVVKLRGVDGGHGASTEEGKHIALKHAPIG